MSATNALNTHKGKPDHSTQKQDSPNDSARFNTTKPKPNNNFWNLDKDISHRKAGLILKKEVGHISCAPT